jgi:cellulose synthase/poly-beta-1,6-N-acetylglucosamine synthase-like glycosyltransferase
MFVEPTFKMLNNIAIPKVIEFFKGTPAEGEFIAKTMTYHSKMGDIMFISADNANSAISRSAWAHYRFDEEVTGLEDMELGQRLVRGGGKVGYIAGACVYHYHLESWRQVERRFEREAIALQKIMPQIHVGPLDALRYIVSSILGDWNSARKQGVWLEKAVEIVKYRFCQYVGSFKGNHEHRKLSHAEKEKYFYPY